MPTAAIAPIALRVRRRATREVGSVDIRGLLSSFRVQARRSDFGAVDTPSMSAVDYMRMSTFHTLARTAATCFSVH
jgi:hypothetical protein